MEAINFERKQLLQQWKSALIGMQRRDEALQATEDALLRQQEQEMALDAEVIGVKKAINKEQERNEVLVSTEGKLEAEMRGVDANIAQCHEKEVRTTPPARPAPRPTPRPKARPQAHAQTHTQAHSQAHTQAHTPAHAQARPYDTTAVACARESLSCLPASPPSLAPASPLRPRSLPLPTQGAGPRCMHLCARLLVPCRARRRPSTRSALQCSTSHSSRPTPS